MVKSRDSRPTLRYVPPKIAVTRLVAAADVEDVRLRLVFLRVLNQEDTAKKVLPDPVMSEDQRVRLPRRSAGSGSTACRCPFREPPDIPCQGTRWSFRPAGS